MLKFGLYTPTWHFIETPLLENKVVGCSLAVIPILKFVLILSSLLSNNIPVIKYL